MTKKPEDNVKEAEINLYQRFEALFASAALSDEEKASLSKEMLKIIFESSGEVK